MEDMDWARPPDPSWEVFENAALRVFDTWDVLQRAIDEEWGGDETEAIAEKCELIIRFPKKYGREEWGCVVLTCSNEQSSD